MERENEAFSKLYQILRTNENYVRRNYQTVGGRWTVDTWKKGNITLQLMDEGYTTRIFSDGLDVIEGYSLGGTYIEFKEGDSTKLEELILIA